MHCFRQMSALLQTETALHQNGVKIIVCTRQRSALHQIDQCTASDQNRTASNRLKIIVCTEKRSALQLPMQFYFRVHCNKGTTKFFKCIFVWNELYWRVLRSGLLFLPKCHFLHVFYSSTTTEWIVWKKFNVFAVFLATRGLHFSHVPNLHATRI